MSQIDDFNSARDIEAIVRAIQKLDARDLHFTLDLAAIRDAIDYCVNAFSAMTLTPPATVYSDIDMDAAQIQTAAQKAGVDKLTAWMILRIAEAMNEEITKAMDEEKYK